jgi:hypothetical protein
MGPGSSVSKRNVREAMQTAYLDKGKISRQHHKLAIRVFVLLGPLMEILIAARKRVKDKEEKC